MKWPHWGRGHGLHLVLQAELVLGLVQRFGVEALVKLAATPQDKRRGAVEGKEAWMSQDLENVWHLSSMERKDQGSAQDTTAALLLLLLQQQGLVEQGQEALLGKVTKKLLANLTTNTHGVGEMVVQEGEGGLVGAVRSFGTGLYNTLALFNHSCLPNLTRVNRRGREVVVVTSREVR